MINENRKQESNGNKNNIKNNNLERNIYGLFSNIEDDYIFILKDIQNRKNRLKKYKNFSSDFNSSKPYNYNENYSKINKNVKKKPKKIMENYINDLKKIEIDEYPFKKENNKIEEFTFKNTNGIENNIKDTYKPNNIIKLNDNKINEFTFKKTSNENNQIENFTFKNPNNENIYENNQIENFTFKNPNNENIYENNINEIQENNINQKTNNFNKEITINNHTVDNINSNNKVLPLNELYSETTESIKREDSGSNIQSFLKHNKLNTDSNLLYYTKSHFSSKSQNKNPIGRYVTEYLESVNNEHCSSFEKIENEKLRASHNYQNNMKILEEWIKEIKDNNSKKEQIIEKKLKVSKKLNKSVNNYSNRVKNVSKKNEKLFSNREKYDNEIQKNIQTYSKNKNENDKENNIIIQIKNENQNILTEIERVKDENKILNEKIFYEKNIVNELNKGVQNFNKNISKIKKEKDIIINNIIYKKKQNEYIKDKVNKQFGKTSNFMLEVNNILRKSREGTKRAKSKK